MNRSQESGNALPLRHLVLIDASSFIFRAYHAIRPLTAPDGTPVNAVYGFTQMLMKQLDDMEPKHVAVIFDVARTTFRNELSPEYKANRPDPPDDLIPQFTLVRDATRAFNLDCIEAPGFEADDLIATYTHLALKTEATVTIVSSDKDLMQLVSDRVRMYDSIKNRYIGTKEVQEKFGVPPKKVVDVQALAGDSIDNVPGVPGIGIKTAAELINEYGDLDTLLARASEIKQKKRRENLLAFADKARLSRELVRLRTDVPLEVPLEKLNRREVNGDDLMEFLATLNFKTIADRIQHKYSSSVSMAEGSAHLTGSTPSRTKPGYELVQTIERLQEWVELASHAGIVAVDTETTSLDQSRAELVGVSLCIEPMKACYIPVGHTWSQEPGQSEHNPPAQVPLADALALLRPLFADPAVLKVGHNIKYDLVILTRYDVAVSPVDDTMVLSYVLEGGSHGHGMDELAELYLGHTTIKYKDITGSGKSQVTFDQVPLDLALNYAAEDADITLRLHHLLKPRLLRERMVTVYETLERPLIPVLASMESEGIKVDLAELQNLSREFVERQESLATEIHGLAGRDFNIGSPKQLGEILFDELGLEGGQKGKSGTYTTNAEVLESLSSQGHALPAKVLEWRQLEKLRNTYSESLAEQVNPITKRVHTSYAMASASTGRLSSTDPNLQNIPIRTEEGRRIRRAFVAEKGHVLLSLDYSQIELRLLAHIADIDVLKQAFKNGQDIHALTASQVFCVELEKIDSAMRRKAKAINFGIIYGISAFGLARQLNVEQSEAATYIKAYFQQYPGIQDYMERTKQFCREHGYVQTLFGRRCHVPGILDKNPAKRNFAERAAINAPIQGAAADILKRAMIRVPPALKEHGIDSQAYMLLTVHDELIFEVAESAAETTGQVVKQVMEHATRPALQLSVPLIVEVGQGPSWDEAH
ncbi:MAG: DNA polymerase I [Nitrospirales bacterium]|nr:DNA polymerase I [Nitrospira sp.]MDR4500743.1 DNA polymerase I [Nitrospirales bacterium]